MKKKLFLPILIGVALGAVVVAVLPDVALAAAKDDICSGLGGCNAAGGLDKIIRNVIDIFGKVVGILAVVMIIYAGARFISSGGDPGKAAEARRAIIYAVIGLAVAALSQVLVRFVIDEATQTPEQKQQQKQQQQR